MAVSTEEATAELNAVLSSPSFVRSPRLSRLLKYLCDKYLAGEADQIKEYSIGVQVLDRPVSFNPATDACARVEVHRLRHRLQKHYETEGALRKFRIIIPLGNYIPSFVRNITEMAPAASVPDEETEAPEVTEAPAIVGREPTPKRRAGGLLIAAGALVIAGLVFLVLPGRRTIRPETKALRPSTVASLSPGVSVRLACGRAVPYTDRSGQTWTADRYFEGGSAFDSPRQYVARAIDPKLFQSGRTGDFGYQIPLSAGSYELRLGFVERDFGPATLAGGGEYSRTFDVKANSRLLLDDFDIYSDANGTNIADTRVFKDISPAPDGFLHLEFHSRRGPALVNLIELTPAPPHRLNPIRIVAQENFVTLSNGTVWSPNMYVIGGVLTSHSVAVTGDDPDLYSHEQYGHFEYAIPVDSGDYRVSIYLAEEYFGQGNPGGGGPGSRLFDIFCNGIRLVQNLDILKEAGMNHALVKTFNGLAPNAQGKLVLSFVPVRNYASLYAIEVVDESPEDPGNRSRNGG